MKTDKIYVVVRNDYESGCAQAGEFRSPTEVVKAFRSKAKALDFVDRNTPPDEAGYGYEIEETILEEE